MRLVAVDNDAPAALVLPSGTSERFRAGKLSRLELLTDPAQWQALQAIRLIFRLATRKAAAPDDPLGEKLLSIEERSLTTRQLSIRFLEQRIPGTMFAIQDVMMRNRGVLSVAPKLLVLVVQALLWLAVAAGIMRRAAA